MVRITGQPHAKKKCIQIQNFIDIIGEPITITGQPYAKKKYIQIQNFLDIKINSEWLTDLNDKYNTVKFLDEYQEKIYLILGLIISFQM